MKKVIILILSVVLFGTMIKPIFAVELNNENKYGMPIKFSTKSDYPGEIVIDGIYVYKDNEDYIFTVLYRNGELEKINNNGKETVKSSFFNPPDGDIVKVTWMTEVDRITSKDNIIQYKIDVEKVSLVESITIFLCDTMYESDADNDLF